MRRITRAILLVDHGSRFDQANELLEDVCRLLNRRLSGDGGEFAFAEFCHMELAEPTIEQGLAVCCERGATDVVVVPYFLAPGRHSRRDIPRMVADAAEKTPEMSVAVADPLGLHNAILNVVMERALEIGAEKDVSGKQDSDSPEENREDIGA